MAVLHVRGCSGLRTVHCGCQRSNPGHDTEKEISLWLIKTHRKLYVESKGVERDAWEYEE